jgi:alanine dehydrogenase
VRPAKVVVLGAGNVGWNAAWIAGGMDAEVVVFDRSTERMRYLDQIRSGRITILASNRGAIERHVADADLNGPSGGGLHGLLHSDIRLNR